MAGPSQAVISFLKTNPAPWACTLMPTFETPSILLRCTVGAACGATTIPCPVTPPEMVFPSIVASASVNTAAPKQSANLFRSIAHAASQSTPYWSCFETVLSRTATDVPVPSRIPVAPPTTKLCSKVPQHSLENSTAARPSGAPAQNGGACPMQTSPASEM
eukprot:gene7681-biopygen7641